MPQMRFSLKKQLIYLPSTSWSPLLCKIIQKPESRSKVMRTPCHFWAKNYPFVPNKKYLVKAINITFICQLVPFSVQNFIKIRRVDSELSYDDGPFFAPKWSVCPNKNLLGKNPKIGLSPSKSLFYYFLQW